MRAAVPDYQLIAPKTLAEVLNKLQAEPGDWTLIAGGTDIMVLYESGKLKARQLISVWQLDELRGLEVTEQTVTMGALTTYRDIQRQPQLRQRLPILIDAARQTGGIAIQNRGTIAGNIANASPAADSPPVLLCLDTEIELASAAGRRWVPYQGFHTAYKQTVMKPDELIARVRFTLPSSQSLQYYEKVGTRRAQAISKVCFCAIADKADDESVAQVRIAIGSVGPTTLRFPKTESVIKGQKLTAELIDAAAEALAEELKPISDIRSTEKYRRRVSVNLLKDFLDKLSAH